MAENFLWLVTMPDECPALGGLILVPASAGGKIVMWIPIANANTASIVRNLCVGSYGLRRRLDGGDSEDFQLSVMGPVTIE